MSAAEVHELQLDRTPPQDVPAEQSVLGAMLMSKDAIANVVEVLRGPDFYRPAHELIFDAVLDLYGRGEPADAVTVAAELTRRGEIGRCGGRPVRPDEVQRPQRDRGRGGGSAGRRHPRISTAEETLMAKTKKPNPAPGEPGYDHRRDPRFADNPDFLPGPHIMGAGAQPRKTGRRANTPNNE